MGLKKFNKPPLTIEQQVSLLQCRGLSFRSKDKAKKILLSIGYYRFSGYCLPFKKPVDYQKFISDVTFEQIVELYDFDRILRCLVLEAIEKIEVQLRAQFTYLFTVSTNDPFCYTNSRWFKDPEKHRNLLQELVASEGKNSLDPTVKHHRETYKEPHPPLWLAVHLMTLGACVHWIKSLNSRQIQDALAKSFGFFGFNPFHSFLISLIEIRNICAHHGRLWNRAFVKPTPFIKKI